MGKPTNADLDKMIDAGIKAAYRLYRPDLYEVARDDIITRSHLKTFLKAAIEAAEKKDAENG